MEKQTNQAVLTIYSQPHVLQHRMKEENLKHGDHVKADIGPIRLESYFGKMVMYFCPMVTVEVKERLTLGDGAVLPAEATLEGFDKLPVNTKPGLYWLKNVELFSNGTMQVIANANSELVPA